MPDWNHKVVPVSGSDVAITKGGAFVQVGGVLDMSNVVALAVTLDYQWATPPTAGKKLSVYARYSENGTDFDDSTVAATLTKIGDITLAAETTARKATLSLEGKVFAKYMRLTFATDEATNAGTVSSVIAVIRKVV